MSDAAETPLTDLMRGVPLDARIVYEYKDRPETQFIPAGRMFHEAADMIERLRTENATLRAERDDAVKKMQAGWLEVCESSVTYLTKERDTLRELVREALPMVSSYWLNGWAERAEKALNT